MDNEKYEFTYKNSFIYTFILLVSYTVYAVVCSNNETIQNFYRNNKNWQIILSSFAFLLPVILLGTVFSKLYIFKGIGIIYDDKVEIHIKNKKYIRKYSEIKNIDFRETSNTKYGVYSGLRIICGVNNTLQFNYKREKKIPMYSSDLYIFFMALKKRYIKYKI